jgi:hypothetical protein
VERGTEFFSQSRFSEGRSLSGTANLMVVCVAKNAGPLLGIEFGFVDA